MQPSMEATPQTSFTKLCFVPSCPNGDRYTVNKDKIFLTVPTNSEIRKKWFEAVGKDFSRTGTVYCCEDHFDLENDAENWNQFKLMGKQIQLKKYVVPHKPLPTEFVNTGNPSSFDYWRSLMRPDSSTEASERRRNQFMYDDSSDFSSDEDNSIFKNPPAHVELKVVVEKFKEEST